MHFPSITKINVFGVFFSLLLSCVKKFHVSADSGLKKLAA